jgi:hypothetical protein
MIDKPPEDEPGAHERFDRSVANALRMPLQHHVKKAEFKIAPKIAKVAARVRSRRRSAD